MNLEKLPVINGILYADGSYEHLKIISNQNHQRKLVHSPKTKLNTEILSDIYINQEILIPGYHIFCGEGSFGGDGFVMAVSLHTNRMAWLAFWDEANPFEQIQFQEHQLFVTNNLHEVWAFELSDPHHIKIYILKQSPYYE